MNKRKIAILEYFHTFLQVRECKRRVIEGLIVPYQGGPVHYLSLRAEDAKTCPQKPPGRFSAREHQCLTWKTGAAQFVPG
jgi:hypothetical protein